MGRRYLRLAWPAVSASHPRRWIDQLLSTAVDAGWTWIRRHGAVTPDRPNGRRYASLGTGSYLAFPQGDLINPHTISIGRDCFLGAGTTLASGMPTEVFGPDHPLVIEIGDRTTLGKDCWIVARDSVVIDADVTIAPNVYITDHNHTYADPWLPVGKQILQCFPVHIGAGTWIGTNVIVLPGTRIGRNCAIAGGSVVRGEIPDHSVVAGVPGRVVRRWSSTDGWQPPLTNEVVVPEGWPVGVPPAE